MKILSLVLMMGFGLVSFAQAEEECITIGGAMMSSSEDCSGKDGKLFYSASALCRKKIGGAASHQNVTCKIDQGLLRSFEQCRSNPVKVKGWNAKVADGKNFSQPCGKPGGLSAETVESIKNSWKKKLCYIKDNDRYSSGDQTAQGCVESGSGKVFNEFYYDRGCTVLAKNMKNDSGKNAVGDSNIAVSDRKLKKLPRKTDPVDNGIMFKPATIPMESVKSNSAQ